MLGMGSERLGFTYLCCFHPVLPTLFLYQLFGIGVNTLSFVLGLYNLHFILQGPIADMLT